MAVRPKGRSFRELKVWEKAHQLTLDAYKRTAGFPREEAFGLTSQIRRSASSIPANIAEGCGRGGGDLARFCRIAAGSASELQYHLLLARDLGFLDGQSYSDLEQQTTEVERMLAGFIGSLQHAETSN
jgi:four helix bundle protein